MKRAVVRKTCQAGSCKTVTRALVSKSYEED